MPLPTKRFAGPRLRIGKGWPTYKIGEFRERVGKAGVGDLRCGERREDSAARRRVRVAHPSFSSLAWNATETSRRKFFALRTTDTTYRCGGK
ncbi:hypothetical protein sS8_3463 [Methylocaldum marinum]|uniref:Uncharacterized protein n=1 Tax=Methylocaldum marinum TaxID=1432792 RepID=A0A250KUS3_9GAMM|nr:hypothetical protein sS8_3463 [Methylocaldum marinum]